MPLLGSHLSIAGGYYKAVDAAAALGMDCVQIFTKNNNQWRAKPLSDGDIAQFRQSLDRTGIQLPCGHTSYLINLASPDEALWMRSLESFIVELQRAEALGLVGLVVHPGACVGAGEEEGIARVVAALKRALDATSGDRVEIWLETTAGQGSCLGHRFEHLRDIFDAMPSDERLGVCIDSCHLFAAGYPLGEPETYRRTMDEFDKIVGLNRVRAFHLNDSKRELGSRVDRHEHIGKGRLGREAFRNILNDRRFARLPMYLETPKGIENGKSLDARNLAALRRLLSPVRTRAKSPRRS